jgi:hypothetical protein
MSQARGTQKAPQKQLEGYRPTGKESAREEKVVALQLWLVDAEG